LRQRFLGTARLLGSFHDWSDTIDLEANAGWRTARPEAGLLAGVDDLFAWSRRRGRLRQGGPPSATMSWQRMAICIRDACMVVSPVRIPQQYFSETQEPLRRAITLPCHTFPISIIAIRRA
jgi:hypothetical protein